MAAGKRPCVRLPLLRKIICLLNNVFSFCKLQNIVVGNNLPTNLLNMFCLGLQQRANSILSHLLDLLEQFAKRLEITEEYKVFLHKDYLAERTISESVLARLPTCLAQLLSIISLAASL